MYASYALSSVNVSSGHTVGISIAENSVIYGCRNCSIWGEADHDVSISGRFEKDTLLLIIKYVLGKIITDGEIKCR